MNDKPKMGRPPISPGRRLTHQVGVRFDDTEWKLVVKASKGKGHFSEFVRKAVMDAVHSQSEFVGFGFSRIVYTRRKDGRWNHPTLGLISDKRMQEYQNGMKETFVRTSFKP